MESENEMVADIAKEMRGITFGEECCPDCGADFQRSNRWIEFADRFEAAHKREVAELERNVAELLGCLRMAVVNARIARTCYAFGRECDNCSQSCNARKWNKVIVATKGAEDEDK